MKKRRMPKPRLKWTPPDGWHRLEPTKEVLGSWETADGENTVVVKKGSKSFVVEASDYMGEYTHRSEYFDVQAAFDGAYDEMWGRSSEWR